MVLNAQIQEISSGWVGGGGAVQVHLTQNALSTNFYLLFFFSAFNLFYRGVQCFFMVYFKENCNFPRFQRGPTFSRGSKFPRWEGGPVAYSL